MNLGTLIETRLTLLQLDGFQPTNFVPVDPAEPGGGPPQSRQSCRGAQRGAAQSGEGSLGRSRFGPWSTTLADSEVGSAKFVGARYGYSFPTHMDRMYISISRYLYIYIYTCF